ncbi:MAG: type II toxin-antitoxin system RelE/ParE family toxin [Pseudomonadota bacterium]
MDEVVWTRRADRNLAEIGAYIAQDDPKAAERTVMRIEERVAGLAFYPLQGRMGRVAGTRELVIGGTSYVAVYRVRERVEIITIRHAAQRWPETIW